jgi:hypothetical protein
MTTSRGDGALYGIQARLRGRVSVGPQLRYSADGQELVEFKLNLIDDGPPAGPRSDEAVVVRYAGAQPELTRWLAVHRHVLVAGTVHLARWTGRNDGRERVQLLCEAVEILALDDNRPDPKRAAAVAAKPPQPIAAAPPTHAQRLERLRVLAEAES